MHDTILYLSITLPYVASVSILIVIFTNLFIIIRKKLPAKVNCWFCNNWLRVPYEKKNSFNCTICSQYNGFNSDGDYNKVIPEQHMNISCESKQNEKSFNQGNGLCKICNNNQQLKVYQLANFVPLNERNYNMEIEHFQKQLDKAYKLCKKCDNVLKNTLDSQNRWLFNMKLLKENKFIKKVINRKLLKDNYVHRVILLVMVIIWLVYVICEMILQIHNLNQYLPSYMWPYAKYINKSVIKTQKFISNSFNFTTNRTDYLLESLKGDYTIIEDVFQKLYTTFVTIFSQFVSEIKSHLQEIISFKYSILIPLIGFVSFSHLLLLKKLEYNYRIIIAWLALIGTYIVNNSNMYVRIIQVCGILMIIHNLATFTGTTKEKKEKTKKKKSKVNVTNLHNTANGTSPKSFAYRPRNVCNNFENSFSSSASGSFSNSPFNNTKNGHVFGSPMLNRSKSPSTFSEISSVSRQYTNKPTNNFNKVETDYGSVFNNSMYNTRSLFTDLNGSFLKLNIGNNMQHMGHINNDNINKLIINKNIDRPRPVLSPAKLNFVETFDKHTMLPVTNLSRSSSQSSGFMSQATYSDSNYQTLPNSCPSMLHGDIDSLSILAEPINQLIDKEAQDKHICSNFYPLPESQVLYKSFGDNYSDYSSAKFKINETNNSFYTNLHLT